jgi:phosphate starvation-inducible PhoH-like protein
MPIGGFELSRARGAKAQKRTPPQSVVTSEEKTINFFTHPKHQNKPIELRPKSLGQEKLVLALTDASLPIVVAVGPAGTGKTYLSMLAAVKALRSGLCKRLILTRPAVEVEDEKHGFLPGNLNAKMEPWTRPLFDVLRECYQHRDIMHMVDDQVIEVAPLAYMRGRTFKDAWIIADEMQNATPAQFKMLMTRIGHNSKIIVTGDVEQADQNIKTNGLLDLGQRLQDQSVNGLAFVKMGTQDIRRHPIISEILQLYHT